MEYLNWDLSVLSRAIAYQNLSGASVHVGISQPQLSRIIAKLESQFGVLLLDRDAKRKSGWTPEAFKLAQTYSRAVRQFNGDILRILEGSKPEHLNIGTLDGLALLAADFCSHIFNEFPVSVVELHVLDLSPLEEQFVKNKLDFIFTSREPGRKKFKHSRILGYQSLESVQNKRSESDVTVMSPFHYALQMHAPAKKKPPRMLVANALFIRQYWLDQFGGTGIIPSAVSKKKTSKEKETVYLLGQEHLPEDLWNHLAEKWNQ